MAGPAVEAQSWKRELATAFTDTEALLDFVGLTPAQLDPAMISPRRFPLLVPRRFAALMRRSDPNDPLLRQVLPTAAETQPTPGYQADPVDDAAARWVPGLLQKYARRALLITTGACAVHCRYCFRRHFPYNEGGTQHDRFAGALAALSASTGIEEVILSGGDPLMLDDDALAALLAAIEQLPALKRVRLHTRIPSILPSRITGALCAALAGGRLQPVVVVHINHPAELDEPARSALLRLSEHGVSLLNQSVLLRGVNDDLETLSRLSDALFSARVLPYYLHLLDPVSGAAHFDIPEQAGRALVARLRECLPGYLVPRLVRERPGAASKTVLV
ncbi:MAG: EF-P beta-lysylation protein EpmB [Gammaproteobacteria bacterium]|nr:EF-P beta-lysylation protein EpmB [Gammaproteobacteria bacterium]